MLSASFGSTPHRRAALTGAADVPCALGAMSDSSPTSGSFAPGAGAAPLHPLESPSGTVDIAQTAAALDKETDESARERSACVTSPRARADRVLGEPRGAARRSKQQREKVWRASRDCRDGETAGDGREERTATARRSAFGNTRAQRTSSRATRAGRRAQAGYSEARVVPRWVHKRNNSSVDRESHVPLAVGTIDRSHPRTRTRVTSRARRGAAPRPRAAPASCSLRRAPRAQPASARATPAR